MATLAIRNMTRGKAPRVPFAKIGKSILPAFDISLVFVKEDAALALNRALRKKTYVPNVLSYQAGDNHGEIIICPAVARREASVYGLPYRDFVALLFIHACLHLNGMRHSATMERKERELLARFLYVPSSHATTNRNRNRHRVKANENRRRRGGSRKKRT